MLTACTNKTGFRSCPEKFTECPAGLGEHSWVWHRGWEWLLCLHHPERGQPWSGCPWASAFHHTDMKEFHKGTLTAASRFMDRKDEPFILYLTSRNFIWACLWRDYSIIYSSTGCHQNNCNECFPHGRSEMTLAVRFWIAQNLTRPTNISALTKQTSEKSCQRTLWAIALFQSSLWAIRLLYSLNTNIFWFDFSSMQFELAKPLFQALELHN